MGKSFVILTRNGLADDGQDAELEAFKARLAEPSAKVLVHLHGGLVDEASGRATAARLSGVGPDAWNLDDDWTELYIVWRTGAFETVRTNWTDLAHDDRLYKALLRRLISFVGRRVGVPLPEGGRSALTTRFDLDDLEILRLITGKGDRREPFADVDVHFRPELEESSRAAVMVAQDDASLVIEFENELKADDLFQEAVADLESIVNEGLPGRAPLAQGNMERGRASLERLDSKLRAEIDAAASSATGARGFVSVGAFIMKRAAEIAYQVFWRFRRRRDHGFHATIVEEVCRALYSDLIGAKVWGMMVQDAADHFSANGFGAQLLDILQNSPAPARFVVTAHSAGSIWASRMLIALHERQQTASIRLFLLAPAARHSEFAEVLDKAADRLEAIYMMTMSDELERRDAVFGHDYGYIYPSSLLYLTSGIFEEKEKEPYVDAPLLGMLRFFDTGFLNAQELATAQKIRNFMALPKCEVLTSPSPNVCMADCHGCFDDEEFTLKSVVTRL